MPPVKKNVNAAIQGVHFLNNEMLYLKLTDFGSVGICHKTFKIQKRQKIKYYILLFLKDFIIEKHIYKGQ